MLPRGRAVCQVIFITVYNSKPNFIDFLDDLDILHAYGNAGKEIGRAFTKSHRRFAENSFSAHIFVDPSKLALHRLGFVIPGNPGGGSGYHDGLY